MKDIDTLIEEMRDGLENLSPGPWVAEDEREDDDRYTGFVIYDSKGFIVGHTISNTPTDDAGERNAMHLAKCSPDNILKLLNEIDRLRNGLADAEERLNRVVEPYLDGYLTCVEVVESIQGSITRSSDATIEEAQRLGLDAAKRIARRSYEQLLSASKNILS